MPHLSEGTLRRIYDEPLALAASDQLHYDGCAACRGRFQEIAGAARSTTALLELPDFMPDPARALGAVRIRITREEAVRPPRWYERWLSQTSWRLRPLATPAIALALAATLITGLAVTGLAGQLIRIFEPRSLVAVQVSPSDLPRAATLLDYGAIKWQPAPPNLTQVADATAARAQSGLPLLMPASLPSSIAGPVSYGIVPHATATVTLDATRLQASAARAGVRVGPMPSSIDGSTLVVNGGPALVEVWGLSAGRAEQQMPTLVIAQTRVPTVDSTGASAQQIEDYLLSQPGVPPDLAAQLRAIKDPSSTLPIPIPQGLATTENVTVNGSPGLLIKAVLGAAVVWQKNGVIYAVGGQLTPDQVLAIATSLH